MANCPTSLEGLSKEDLAAIAAGDMVAPPPTVLGEGWGWFVVLGFGTFFTLLTMVVSNFEMKATGKKITSEHFNTAGRDVGAGLTAAVIVSQWTWAATLLQSSNVGWKYGVSGPFWYASGATIQILLFAILAIQVKIRAPHMHTYLEVIKIRWGTVPHIVFIGFALACNVIVTSMLLLGGAATIEDLTGMDREWSSFLIPFGVLVYTAVGGLRATFFASYIHTTVIFVVLVTFGFSVYTGDTDSLGSAKAVYTSLTAASLKFATGSGGYPFAEGIIENGGLCYDQTSLGYNSSTSSYTITTEMDLRTLAGRIAEGEISDGGHCSYDECNEDTGVCSGVAAEHIAVDDKGQQWSTDDCSTGQVCVPSYVTMTSGGGLAFGIINIVGNFGTVFVDQAYWQSAIAAEPKATVSGFLIGGMVWFAVPFFMATTFGLAGRALSMSPAAGGACVISATEAGNGLVPAKTIVKTLGEGGAFALLMQLFMAITSTGSAEAIAVSSILTYDVYWTYLNPELKSKVKKASMKWEAALKAAGIGASSTTDEAEPPVETPADETTIVTKDQAEALLKSLIQQGWAKDDCDVTADQIMAGGDKLFEVKATCIDIVSDSAAYEGKILVRMSRFFTCVFTIFMGFLAILLNQLGLGLGWVYQAMGNIIGSAVVPVALAILYEKANGKVCTAAAIIGFLLAMMSWVWKTANDSECKDSLDALCNTWDGVVGSNATAQAACLSMSKCGVTIDNMGALYPNLVGNIVAICTSGFIAVVGSLIMPDNEFKWEKLSEIDVVDDVIPELKEDEQPEMLKKHATRANIQALVLTIILVVIWPIPQHWSQGVFTQTGFAMWIGCAFCWALIAGLVIIILPPLQFAMKAKAADAARP